jgi:hypothetical protein
MIRRNILDSSFRWNDTGDTIATTSQLPTCRFFYLGRLKIENFGPWRFNDRWGLGIGYFSSIL